MYKKFLCSPGPTQVPAEVTAEMSKPLIHHRTPQFSGIIKENLGILKYVFQTENPVITLTSSGTGAMEASITNFLSKGSKALILSAGKFGERFAEICSSFGVEVLKLEAPYGDDIKAEKVEHFLNENHGIRAVYTEYSETSTGVAFDIRGIAAAVRKTNAILIVDGITAIGAMEFKMDEWGVDVALAGSQKSFMIPPGLSFISVSKKAEEFMNSSDLPKFYFNLGKELKNLEKFTTAWTPAITLFVGLNKALKMINDEGLDNIIQRHKIAAQAVRSGVQAIDLSLLARIPDVLPSDTLTAVRVPKGIDGNRIPGIMRDRYGVTIAGGQGSLKGDIFRLGHLGFFDKTDIIIELQALELTLKDLGYNFEPGKSLAAAEKVINEKYPRTTNAVSDIGD